MADGHEECGERRDKILLFLSNNQVFVWDKDAVMILRKQHRIVGSLVGSLPSKPRQNLMFSLPLVLLPEEARLLLDKNIAKMVESDITRPTQEIIRKFQDERKASIQEQIERLQEIKQQKLADFAEIIEEGREKRNRKRKMFTQDSSRKQRHIETEQRQSSIESNLELIGDTRKQSQDTPTSGTSLESGDGCPRKQLYDICTSLESANSSGSKQPEGICLSLESVDGCPRKQWDHIHRSSESADGVTQKDSGVIRTSSECADGSGQKLSEDNRLLSEISDEASLQDSTLVCVNTKSEILRTKDVIWKFPETEIEQARCKVFSDLWEKGYFITNGNKFGGDYLVYPGDPLRFHSHFIVKILPSGERLTGLDLVSVGRLGSTVKKTSVLASVDSLGKVIDTSVQWSGFS